jgi:hypothetical protein
MYWRKRRDKRRIKKREMKKKGMERGRGRGRRRKLLIELKAGKYADGSPVNSKQRRRR